MPATYNGLEFKSHLEAQWAAFFDLAKWSWRTNPVPVDGWRPDFRVTFPCGHSECSGDHTLLVSVVEATSVLELDGQPALSHSYGVRDHRGKGRADGGAAFGIGPSVTVFEISHGAGGGVFRVSWFEPDADTLWARAAMLVE